MTTDTVYEIQYISGGRYYHFGVVKKIKHSLDCDILLRSHSTINVQLNIDGLPLFKSTNEQFWPILGLLMQIKTREPFPIGLFCGNAKPKKPAEFLHDVVDELVVLQNEGLAYNDGFYKVTISSVICDTPARAYVNQVKSHSGYLGCDKCTQEGVYNKKMTFPDTNATLRTDESFSLLADEVT